MAAPSPTPSPVPPPPAQEPQVAVGSCHLVALIAQRTLPDYYAGYGLVAAAAAAVAAVAAVLWLVVA